MISVRSAVGVGVCHLAGYSLDGLSLGKQGVKRHELISHVVHVDRVPSRSTVFADHLPPSKKGTTQAMSEISVWPDCFVDY